MAKKHKWTLKFASPSKGELVLVVIAALSLILLDAGQNVAQESANPFTAMTWWGLSALASWWIFFSIYNIALFAVFSRALRHPATSSRWDVMFGILGFVMLLFLLGAGIAAFYVQPDAGIPYFFNVPQITLYHVAILGQWLTLLYFTLTG